MLLESILLLSAAYVNPTGSEFPIMGWHTFEYEHLLTVENYQTFKDAGFNIAYLYSRNPDRVDKALECCEEVGLKVMINTRNGGFENTKKIVDKYKDHPQIVLYNLQDEPTVRDFGELSQKMEYCLENLPEGKMPYANLFSEACSTENYAPSYQCYAASYITSVCPLFISYDHYGIMQASPDKDPVLTSTYFDNLEIIHSLSKEYGKPMWTFVLGAPHNKYPVPTKAQLSFQIFTELAYGSQCIQYFGYGYREDESHRTPVKGQNFHDTAIDSLGRKTKSWYAMRDVNHEVRDLSKVFLGMDVKKVWHTGEKLPKGVTELDEEDLPAPIHSVSAQKKGVVVSYFTNGDANYLLVVNKDFNYSQQIEVERDNYVKSIRKYEKPQSKSGSPRTVTDKVTLDPGAWRLYTW